MATGLNRPRGPRSIRHLADPRDTPHQQALDEWTAYLWAETGMAIGRWLEDRGKLDQPILSLTREELAGMAWAAVSRYQDLRCVQAEMPPLPAAPAPTFGI